MSHKKIKILLVEDDPMIVEMYRTRLEEEGYEVLTTEIGTEAVALAKEQKPTVILLDVILPEMDGFAILQILRQQVQTKDTPVIMLTNLGQDGDQAKGQERGANAYLVKAKHTPAEVINEIKKFIKSKI